MDFTEVVFEKKNNLIVKFTNKCPIKWFSYDVIIYAMEYFDDFVFANKEKITLKSIEYIFYACIFLSSKIYDDIPFDIKCFSNDKLVKKEIINYETLILKHRDYNMLINLDVCDLKKIFSSIEAYKQKEKIAKYKMNIK